MVLECLCTLYPLEHLSLKDLTLKLITLVALATAARAQSLSALDLKFMHKNEEQDVIVFQKKSNTILTSQVNEYRALGGLKL
jgi:hypothetical protein